jgi:ABC-2 type transport system permease protein
VRSLITVVAFAGKEIRQVLRQPKLMAALILGPFLILGLFAAGFQPNPPPLKTLLVLPQGSGLETRVPEIQETIGNEVDLVGTTSDEAQARRQLLDGEVELVVVAPPDAADTIRDNSHATIMVFHDRLDPFDRAYITVSAQAAVDELNRAVLSEVADVAQDRAGDYQEALPAARRSAGEMAEAMRSGDEAAARRAQSEAAQSLGIVEDQLATSSDFFSGVDRSLGAESDSLGDQVTGSRTGIEEIDPADPDSVEQVEAVEADLAELEDALADFRAVSPDVLAQPFVAQTGTVEGNEIPLTTYYSPAVVVVLLQHVVLTFAALSVVNERSTGATEMFRVGPIRTGEFLAGKFLGYALLGIAVAALLMAGVVFLFGTPMLGSWAWLVLVLALTMAASLGLGFIIAAAANSDAQAVQFAMLALLFTIFFSGLVVSLSRLADGVRQVAYLAPATAGTAGLQDVMFRGQAPAGTTMAILVGYAVVSLSLAYLWLRRRQVA